MTLNQALSLCVLLLDFEIEQPQVQPPPEAWEQELREAKRTINEAIGRDPGRFFTSAENKSRGRPSLQVINR